MTGGDVVELYLGWPPSQIGRRRLLQHDRERSDVMMGRPSQYAEKGDVEYWRRWRDRRKRFQAVGVPVTKLDHEPFDSSSTERHPNQGAQLDRQGIRDRIPEALIDREGRYGRDDPDRLGQSLSAAAASSAALSVASQLKPGRPK
jgi:hypothetical protein